MTGEVIATLRDNAKGNRRVLISTPIDLPEPLDVGPGRST